MKNTNLIAVLWFIWGCINFIVFAYDVEYDRDVYTWLWLLTSQISFMQCLRLCVRYDRESKVD